MQTVREPTRTTPSSNTLIDLTFANIDSRINVENTPNVSDHAWISITFKNDNREFKNSVKKEISKTSIT